MRPHLRELCRRELKCEILRELSLGGAELTLRRVSPKVVPENVAPPEAAQQLIATNLENPKLFVDPALFVREKR